MFAPGSVALSGRSWRFFHGAVEVDGDDNKAAKEDDLNKEPTNDNVFTRRERATGTRGLNSAA